MDFSAQTSSLLREFDSEADLRDKKPASCAHCGSVSLVRWGGDSRKARYRCKDCRKTFVMGHGSLLFRKRITPFLVAEIGRDLRLNTTLRQTSKRLGISLTTCFYWRHRLLDRLAKSSVPSRLFGNVIVDETYVNTKGYWRQGDRNRGISRQKVCLMVGIDGNGDIAIGNGGPGRPNKDKLFGFWKDHLRTGSMVTHDDLMGYEDVFGRLHCGQRWEKSTSKLSLGPMQPVNSLCSSLKWFLRKHNGLAIRHLGKYFAWYELLRDKLGLTTEIRKERLLQRLTA